MNHSTDYLGTLLRSRLADGMFGRMFRGLPAYEPEGETLAEREGALGRLAQHRFRTIDRENDLPEHLDNERIPAGYTYLGQLIAHDLSLDPLPVSARATDPELITNYRTPRLDLDCLYGRGPRLDPHLYSSATPDGPDARARRGGRLARVLFGEGRARQQGEGRNAREPDLPRSGQLAVRLGYADTTTGVRRRKRSVEALIAERTGLEPDDLVEVASARGAKARGPEASALRSALARGLTELERFTIRIHPDCVTRWHGPRGGGRYALVGNDLSVYARRLGAEGDALAEWDWIEVAPDELVQAGRAVIADPRNDDNVIVSQLHLALMRFHDRVVRKLAAERPTAAPLELFEEARRLVRWHYQWIVAHDYLDKVVGEETAEVARGRIGEQRRGSPFSWSNQPYIPIEFAAGAFRMGHSMIRASYDLNHVVRRVAAVSRRRSDLRGGRPLRARWSLQWDLFFGERAQPSRRIDHNVVEPLSRLPVDGRPRSLMELDLLRSWKLGLPSGQAVARALGAEDAGDGETPLLLYVLEEAETAAAGRHLGPVGGRIVAETLIGLLEGDPTSYLSLDPEWTPARAGLFDTDDLTFLDVARFAGLPVTAEEWDAHLTLPPSVGPDDDGGFLKPPPRRGGAEPRTGRPGSHPKTRPRM